MLLSTRENVQFLEGHATLPGVSLLFDASADIQTKTVCFTSKKRLCFLQKGDTAALGRLSSVPGNERTQAQFFLSMQLMKAHPFIARSPAHHRLHASQRRGTSIL
jgi:hypothetical protein